MLSTSELEKYFHKIYGVVKPTPKLKERWNKKHGWWEGYDPKTGRVYIIYGHNFRKAVREMTDENNNRGV